MTGRKRAVLLLAFVLVSCNSAPPPNMSPSPQSGDGSVQSTSASPACTMSLTQVGPGGPGVWLHVEYLNSWCGTPLEIPKWRSETACVQTAYCGAPESRQIPTPSDGTIPCEPGGACAFDALISGKPGDHVVHAYSAHGSGHVQITVHLTQ